MTAPPPLPRGVLRGPATLHVTPVADAGAGQQSDGGGDGSRAQDDSSAGGAAAARDAAGSAAGTAAFR